jgi:uncharacterized protein (TIGR04255 family)
LSDGLGMPLTDRAPSFVRSRHYDHAPIAEAIIDIRCALPPAVSLDDLARVVDDETFTDRQNSMAVEQSYQVGPEGVTGEMIDRQIGYVFRRADGRRIVHPRFDGFGFSWLEPYETWEAFSAEAEGHWLRYRTVVAPVRAHRLGVRYVNRIDVPSQSIEIQDYLRLGVDVPAYLPQSVTSYFMQVTIPLVDFNCFATITSSILPPRDENSTSLLLDVDTWQVGDIELTTDTEALGVRENLETLRGAKNYVFESCITDATRGLID